MELNEIKKHLLKFNPHASFRGANKEGLIYMCALTANQPSGVVYFRVPLDELSVERFEPLMGSKLLIRYIINH